MIAWTNFAVLIFSTLLFLYFYFLSVGPAALERAIGPVAYRRCGQYRMIAMVFETITVACYVVYRFFPLATPLPESFPWPWWVSGVIAAVIGVPTVALMFIGMKDAGEEALTPKKEHTMYGGIYARIRHPQAAGEVFGWLWIAFLLNSPFLVAFSFVYFPIFLIMSWAEEHDLLLRYGAAYAEYWRWTGAFWPKRNSATRSLSRE
jgi:protein-S-isoprenylcysteine O-methyltransferase Ste14